MGLKFSHGLFLGGLLSAVLMEDQNTLKLHYFNIRGRAEALRVAFADREIEFTDKTFTSDEWGKGKPDGLKATWTNEGKLMFGQVPMLETNDQNDEPLHLVQSQAIFRYIASRHGWYDSYNTKTVALIDAAGDGTEDIRKQLTAIKYDNALDDAEKSARYKAWCTDHSLGETWFGFFDSMADKSSSNFLISGTTSPTHADYLLFDLLDSAEGLAPTDISQLLASFPELSAWRVRMSQRPNIAAYLASEKRRD